MRLIYLNFFVIMYALSSRHCFLNTFFLCKLCCLGVHIKYHHSKQFKRMHLHDNHYREAIIVNLIHFLFFQFVVISVLCEVTVKCNSYNRTSELVSFL